jgi:hypothetical protein
MSFEHDQQQPDADEPVRMRSGQPPIFTVGEQPLPVAPRPSRRNRNVVYAIVGAVVVLGAGIGVGVALSGSSAPAKAAAAASSGPAQIEMDGALTIPFLGSDLFAPQAEAPGATGSSVDQGDPCVTLGGFTDITAGAAVTIGDSTGKTVAVGALEAGTVAAQADNSAACEFDFAIQVPAGLSEYTVTISHRGTQVFTPEQVHDGQVKMTLGAPGQ